MMTALRVVSPFRRRFLAQSALIALLGLGACSETAPDEAASDTSQTLETISYTVRGIVAELPDPEVPTASLKVRHEPMPHYQRGDGTLGMNAMTMPFPPGPELSLEGIEVGQKVQLMFEVDYLQRPDSDKMSPAAFRAISIEILPEDTELNFENPPASNNN